MSYLNQPAVKSVLMHLTLKEIDFPPHFLYQVLQLLPNIDSLRIIAPVTKIFPRYEQHPLLKSSSLRELSYEIRPAQQTKTLASPATSYYEYLCESLREGGLPRLQVLHVRDENFGKMLKRFTETMPTYGKGFEVLLQLQQLTIHAKDWNGLVWNTFRLNDDEEVDTGDEFSAILAAAGGTPRSPRFLGIPGGDAEKRLSWKERRESRRSRMDLWR